MSAVSPIIPSNVSWHYGVIDRSNKSNRGNSSNIRRLKLIILYDIITYLVQNVNNIFKFIFHETLLPLTLKTSLNTSLVNIFHWTSNAGSLSVVINQSLEVYVIEISNLNYTFLLLKVTYFFNCNDLGTVFWILHLPVERSTGISTSCVHYLLYH